MFFIIVLNIKDDCEDNRPDPKPGLNKDDHPDCFKTCAEYKAMGACNSVWNTCVPDDSELAEKEINGMAKVFAVPKTEADKDVEEQEAQLCKQCA